MIQIIPSILTDNPLEAREMLQRCEGIVDRVSIDIIDEKFADNKTIDPSVFEDVDTNLKLDYQLIVYEPIKWVERCIRGQADRIIGHIEHMSNQIEFVGKVQEVGALVGLALDLDTPVERLEPTILNNLDVVLVMSVPAGFGGQKYHPKVIEKIKWLNEVRVRDDTPFKIQDDGGITFQSIYNIHREGVDEVSIGRSIFKGDLRENIERFQLAAHRMK